MSPFQCSVRGGFQDTLKVCWSTAATRISTGGPLGASSAVSMVTVSEGSDTPMLFWATILKQQGT